MPLSEVTALESSHHMHQFVPQLRDTNSHAYTTACPITNTYHALITNTEYEQLIYFSIHVLAR
ncbi:hypothetical protein E2C01_076326 [Portunus trituberculatus]|uniref:Uncharacterized protein n=1 Tax=Portunus trituberculatus TaxID=210409 RepID=A0A5B7II95_PORTR|nr:hypothetical protein [Portunus trituberculatus]